MRLCVFVVIWASVVFGPLDRWPVHAQTLPRDLLGTYVGDFEALEKRRLIRVLVPFSKTIYFVDKGAQYGTAVDFGRELEKRLNKDRKREIQRIRVAFVPTPREKLVRALIEGRGDVIMANLTITPNRQELVDFTLPVYGEAEEVLVVGNESRPITSLDDLAEEGIPLRKSSSYYEHLTAINGQRQADGMPVVAIRAIDENLEDEDLLEMVNAGLLNWTIVDRHTADVWAGIFPNISVHPTIKIASDGKIAWAIRKDSPRLKAVLDEFVKNHRIGTTFGNILKRKFYQSDRMVKRAYSPKDVEQFQILVATFQRYGEKYSFDYLMLAAQGYQESQLDQSRRSSRGAVGIMQLLPSTAADKAVGIKGVATSAERNIEAGAKYMRHLVDTYIDDEALPQRERLLFALAAYNAGPGNLRKFRRRAEAMNLNPNVWFGNVEHASAAVVGRETVRYVGNIYKYYVAYTRLAEHSMSSHALPSANGVAE